MAASAHSAATAQAAASAAVPQAKDTGARLFAQSARNLFPRLISNLGIASVGCLFVGPLWSLAWFAGVWTLVFIGIALMNQMQKEDGSARGERIGRWLTMVNVCSGAVSSALPAALWFTGNEVAPIFGVISLAISSAYVLLHYYANLPTFLTLIAPYVAALGA